MIRKKTLHVQESVIEIGQVRHSKVTGRYLGVKKYEPRKVFPRMVQIGCRIPVALDREIAVLTFRKKIAAGDIFRLALVQYVKREMEK